MMGWYGDYEMFGGGWGMAVTMLLVWALLVGIAVVLVRLTVPTHRGASTEARSDSKPEPKAILDERFARGELEEDEYRARKAALSNSR
jgi:putative membrane protein